MQYSVGISYQTDFSIPFFQTLEKQFSTFICNLKKDKLITKKIMRAYQRGFQGKLIKCPAFVLSYNEKNRECLGFVRNTCLSKQL